MKYSLAIVAFMGLTLNQSDVNAIKITKDDVPSSDELLTCGADIRTEDWKTDLPGLYDGSAVNNLDGEAAFNALKVAPFAAPEFVVAYHPQCPHCHKMVEDYKKVAADAKEKGIKVNVIAVNMSKTGKYADELQIDGFPTVRLYSAPGQFKEFDGEHRNYDGFVQFLKKEGVKWA